MRMHTIWFAQLLFNMAMQDMQTPKVYSSKSNSSFIPRRTKKKYWSNNIKSKRRKK